jgi:hypothetical protein
MHTEAQNQEELPHTNTLYHQFVITVHPSSEQDSIYRNDILTGLGHLIEEILV